MMDDLRDPMCQIPPAFTAVEPQGLLRGGYVEPPDLAERWNLKEKMSNGKTEYSGPNPTGNGATKDGFILFTDGTGWDRKLDRYYTSKEIAEMAGIASEAYGPYARWLEERTTSSHNSFNSFNSSQKSTQDTDDLTWRAPTFPSTRRHPAYTSSHLSQKLAEKQQSPPVRQEKCTPLDNERDLDYSALEMEGLYERLFSAETIKFFEIQVDGAGYLYPTYHPDGTPSVSRWKNSRSDGNPKYRWAKNQRGASETPLTKPAGYGLNLIVGQLDVYVVGGEPDVWTAHQAGLPAVATFGEMQNYLPLMQCLRAKGVQKVIIVLDNDGTGHRGTAKAIKAAQEAGLGWEVKDIGGDEKNDWNSLFQSLDGDVESFRLAISSLANIDEDSLGLWMGEEQKDVLPPTHIRTGGGNELNELNKKTPLHVGFLQNDSEQFTIPIPEKAMYGVVGDFVRLIATHTETHPMAIVVQILVAFAAMIGIDPHFRVEQTIHSLRLYATMVGQSAKGRKGTSWQIVKSLMEAVDPEWVKGKIVNGLSSGEGLVNAVRDPIIKRVWSKDESGAATFEDVMEDEGIEDKRLLVVEDEFASALRVMERQGTTLSAVIRKLWDDGTCRFMTKSSPMSTTASHVNIIGHIVEQELKSLLSSNDAANGFANRFLWIHVHRTKLLPEGGGLDELDFTPITERIGEAALFAESVGEIRRDADARARWTEIYYELAEEKAGIVGIILGRGEAQVMRLACLYAILDCSEVVRTVHLDAAYAIWQYVEATVMHLFGGQTGDKIADRLIEQLRSCGSEGMSMTEIHDLFDRNVQSKELKRSLKRLRSDGLARLEKRQEGAGRPTEIWFAVEGV